MSYFLRFFLAGFLLYLVFVFVRLLIQDRHRKKLDVSKDMVRCAQCQLFLPKQDAVKVKDKFFCCKEHSKEAAQ